MHDDLGTAGTLNHYVIDPLAHPFYFPTSSLRIPLSSPHALPFTIAFALSLHRHLF